MPESAHNSYKDGLFVGKQMWYHSIGRREFAKALQSDPVQIYHDLEASYDRIIDPSGVVFTPAHEAMRLLISQVVHATGSYEYQAWMEHLDEKRAEYLNARRLGGIWPSH